MSYPLVSVIVPVYGVENYILDCLKSLYAQTYSNYEVILVDDGSPDNSAKIIEDYMQKSDKNIFRLIRKENGGVSSARNRGICEAKGEWVTFVDSDDFVSPEYLSYMIEGLQKNPADLCISGEKFLLPNGTFSGSSSSSTIYYGSKPDVLRKISLGFLHGKMYSMDIIKHYNIFFDVTTKVCEDRSFNFLYLCYVKTCLILPIKNYIYRQRVGSAISVSAQPAKKKNLWSPVRKFWLSFEDESTIKSAFMQSHHLAYTMMDSILAEVINAVLDGNSAKLKMVINDPIAQFCFKNYKFKSARFKEKFLCFLLKSNMLMLFRIVVRVYYSKFLFSLLKLSK